jgi:hypothetical protein
MKKIISMKYAKRLIKLGKAENCGTVTNTDDGKRYMVVNRYDLQIVQHAKL